MRTKGVGGSDAHLFLKAGISGNLSTSARERLKDIKWGRIRPTGASTDAMKAGHDFEKWFAELLGEKAGVPEYLMVQDLLNIPFLTYAHADFFADGRVFECKFSQASTSEVAKTYEAQLQWYYIMGATVVYLIHGQGDTTDGKAKVANLEKVAIAPNKAIQRAILDGLQLAAEFYNTLPTCEFETEAPKDELKDLATEVGGLQAQINVLEAQLKEKKELLLRLMNEQGLDKLDTPTAKITYVHGLVRQSFDVKKYKEDHPDQYDQYIKKTNTSDSLKIFIVD